MRGINLIFELEFWKIDETSSDLDLFVRSRDGKLEGNINEAFGSYLNPFIFCSSRFYAFDQGTYGFMVNDLLEVLKVTVDTLKGVNILSPLNLRDQMRIKSCLMVNNDNVIYLKSHLLLRIIPYVGQWMQIAIYFFNQPILDSAILFQS